MLHINEKILWALIGLFISMSSCALAQKESNHFEGNTINKRLMVDGVEREYILYIPKQVKNSNNVPLVFMLHGSSGTGKQFYKNSGWNEVADREGFIVCYPTALKYPVVKEKENHPNGFIIKKSTKWTSLNLINDVKPGTKIIDDVPYFKKMIEVFLDREGFVDPSRIYIAGFSGGGGIIKTRLIDEMSNYFAAFGTSGGIMSEVLSYNNPRKVSIKMLVGMKDDRFFTEEMLEQNISIHPDSLMAVAKISDQIQNVLKSLKIKKYKMESNLDKKGSTTFDFFENGTSNNRFCISFIKGLMHRYPNPKNNPIGFEGAETHWDYFKDKKLH